MSVFKRFIEWLNESPYEKALNEINAVMDKQVSFEDSMVGEPVVSFIESFKREPKRYRIRKIYQAEWTGAFYHWMKGDGLYLKMVDRKTNIEYPAYIHKDRLEQVVGLPFDLNHWEKVAITKAITEEREKVGIRLNQMRVMQQDRVRNAKKLEESKARLEFAKQFQ